MKKFTYSVLFIWQSTGIDVKYIHNVIQMRGDYCGVYYN